MESNERAPVVATVGVVAVLALVALVLLVVGRGQDDAAVSGSPDGTTYGAIASGATTGGAGDGGGGPGREGGSGGVAPAATDTAPPGSRTRTGAPSAPTASTCVPQVIQTPLTVVSFNIHSARGPGDVVDLGRIGQELAAVRSDVVLLQEVDRGRDWSRRLDMPAILASQLGMEWAFGANVVRSATNLYGTAVLSRYPIVDSDNVLLTRPGDTQQRGLLRVRLDVDGVPVTVYNTHLEASSAAAREAQARQIVPLLRADPGAKIFGGDLNATPNTPVLADLRTVLADSWSEVGAGSGLTAPGGSPRVRIDYVLHGSGQGTELTALQAQVTAPSAVSDHRALRTVLQLSRDDGDVCIPVVPEQGS